MRAKAIAILFGTMLPGATVLAAQVIGSVTTTDGSPVSGANVYSFIHAPPHLSRAATDGKGSFSLTSPTGAVVHVYSPGFRPWSKLVLPNSGPVQIILEDAAASEWKVPHCEGLDGRWGWNWKFWLPAGLKPEPEATRGPDSVGNTIQYPGSKTSETLIITLGSAIAGDRDDFVNDDLIQESTSFEERHITVYNSKDRGLDSRGKLGPDKFWRSSMSWSADAEYYGVSAEAAAFFDRIIDSACFSGG
jgi:hypothetical protein